MSVDRLLESREISISLSPLSFPRAGHLKLLISPESPATSPSHLRHQTSFHSTPTLPIAVRVQYLHHHRVTDQEIACLHHLHLHLPRPSHCQDLPRSLACASTSTHLTSFHSSCITTPPPTMPVSQHSAIDSMDKISNGVKSESK